MTVLIVVTLTAMALAIAASWRRGDFSDEALREMNRP